MSKQQFFKGLAMTVVSVFITFITQVPVDYALMAVTAIAVVLAYVGKNLIGLVSTSASMTLNWVNVLSALLLAVATGITESVAMIVVNHEILWLTLLKIVGSVVLTYVAGTLFTGPNAESKKLI